MISRLVTEKGCRDFFQVAAALHARARFVHVARDLDQSDSVTEEMAAAASRHVMFAGPVQDVRPYLAAADIVLMPSYREGIPARSWRLRRPVWRSSDTTSAGYGKSFRPH